MNGGMEHLGEGEAWGQGPDEGLCGVPRTPQEQWVQGRRAALPLLTSSRGAHKLAHKLPGELCTSPCSQAAEEQRESIQGTEDEAVGEEVSSKASP